MSKDIFPSLTATTGLNHACQNCAADRLRNNRCKKLRGICRENNPSCSWGKILLYIPRSGNLACFFGRLDPQCAVE